MKKQALIMSMPEDKRAGYYAQIVKALAGTNALFDRYKEVLVVNEPESAASVIDVLAKYKVGYEQAGVRLLDNVARWMPTADDFGFVSASDNHYLFEEPTCIFRFEGSEGDVQMALIQMEEHLLAEFGLDGAPAYAVERSHDELMTGIAKAYGCKIRFAD